MSSSHLFIEHLE